MASVHPSRASGAASATSAEAVSTTPFEQQVDDLWARRRATEGEGWSATYVAVLGEGRDAGSSIFQLTGGVVSCVVYPAGECKTPGDITTPKSWASQGTPGVVAFGRLLDGTPLSVHCNEFWLPCALEVPEVLQGAGEAAILAWWKDVWSATSTGHLALVRRGLFDMKRTLRHRLRALQTVLRRGGDCGYGADSAELGDELKAIGGAANLQDAIAGVQESLATVTDKLSALWSEGRTRMQVRQDAMVITGKSIRTLLYKPDKKFVQIHVVNQAAARRLHKWCATAPASLHGPLRIMDICNHETYRLRHLLGGGDGTMFMLTAAAHRALEVSPQARRRLGVRGSGAVLDLTPFFRRPGAPVVFGLERMATLITPLPSTRPNPAFRSGEPEGARNCRTLPVPRPPDLTLMLQFDLETLGLNPVEYVSSAAEIRAGANRVDARCQSPADARKADQARREDPEDKWGALRIQEDLLNDGARFAAAEAELGLDRRVHRENAITAISMHAFCVALQPYTRPDSGGAEAGLVLVYRPNRARGWDVPSASETSLGVPCGPITTEDAVVEPRGVATAPDMLREFVGVIQRVMPDMLVGHNTSSFDWPYLFRYALRFNSIDVMRSLSRMEFIHARLEVRTFSSGARGDSQLFIPSIPGVVSFDTWKFSNDNMTRKSHSLDSIAGDLGMAKVVMDPASQWAAWRSGTPAELAQLAFYCFVDSQLCARIVVGKKMLEQTYALAGCSFAAANDVLYRGQQVQILSLYGAFCLRTLSTREGGRIMIPGELRKAQRDRCGLGHVDMDAFVDTWSCESTGIAYIGGCVLFPLSLLMLCIVACLDFASLYPTTAREGNISTDTRVVRDEDMPEGAEYFEVELGERQLKFVASHVPLRDGQRGACRNRFRRIPRMSVSN